jgi:hypothetical protein
MKFHIFGFLSINILCAKIVIYWEKSKLLAPHHGSYRLEGDLGAAATTSTCKVGRDNVSVYIILAISCHTSQKAPQPVCCGSLLSNLFLDELNYLTITFFPLWM